MTVPKVRTELETKPLFSAPFACNSLQKGFKLVRPSLNEFKGIIKTMESIEIG